MNPDHIVAIVVGIFAVVCAAALYVHCTTPTYQDILLKLVKKPDPITENEK